MQRRDGGEQHLLSRAFGQCVAITQVIDFYVFDVVTVGNVDVAIQIARTLTRGDLGRRGSRSWTRGRADGRNIYMLDAFSRLEVCIDFGSGRGSTGGRIRCASLRILCGWTARRDRAATSSRLALARRGRPRATIEAGIFARLGLVEAGALSRRLFRHDAMVSQSPLSGTWRQL